MNTARMLHPVAPLAGTTLPASLRRYVRTPKGVLTLLFLPLLAVAGTGAGWATVLPHLLAALAGAVLIDLLVTWLKDQTGRWPSGALLSGVIVAFVLSPTTPWAVTLAIGAVASASKALLTARGRHLFNPAALALLVAVPLFGTGQSWWGALPDLPWPWVFLLLAIGAATVDRVNKWPLALTFTGAYVGLLTAVALVEPARVAELFRAPFLHAALFLAAFMLTDPPTSAGPYGEQVRLGLLVAVGSVAAYLLGMGQAYLLIGVLAGNLLLAWRRRQPGHGRSVPTPTRSSHDLHRI